MNSYAHLAKVPDMRVYEVASCRACVFPEACRAVIFVMVVHHDKVAAPGGLGDMLSSSFVPGRPANGLTPQMTMFCVRFNAFHP